MHFRSRSANDKLPIGGSYKVCHSIGKEIESSGTYAQNCDIFDAIIGRIAWRGARFGHSGAIWHQRRVLHAEAYLLGWAVFVRRPRRGARGFDIAGPEAIADAVGRYARAGLYFRLDCLFYPDRVFTLAKP